MVFEVDVPDGCILHSVSAHLTAAGGHASDLSGISKPAITVKRINLFSGVIDVLGTGSDSSTTATQYQAATPHQIGANCSDAEISRSVHRLIVEYIGETGGGFIAGSLVYGVHAEFATATSDDRGAG
jgi:hypothetical protein